MITLEQLQAGIVLPIDKPRQWTSFQAVNKIKAVVRNTYGLKKFKIGHAGTLDPLATGLLLVCLGKATKRIPVLQDGDKVYTGTLVFGATTPCYDLERAIDSFYPYKHITLEVLKEKARQFEGTIMQVPPMFSAVKIEGQRAYEYARRDPLGATASQSTDDHTVTIQPKPVNVYSFEITDFRGLTSQPPLLVREGEPKTGQPSPLLSGEGSGVRLYQNPLGTIPPYLPQADFRIRCGKGTYIRSLARDLGTALGSGAFLSALRREQVGDYSIDRALQLDEVESYLKSD